MTDRELLRLAAISCAELRGEWVNNEAYFDGVLSRWNPLTDDGDALRLAVMLRLSVNCDGDEPWVEWSDEDAEDGERHVSEGPNGDDHFAATRRAIVRAAAEIGKNKGE